MLSIVIVWMDTHIMWLSFILITQASVFTLIRLIDLRLVTTTWFTNVIIVESMLCVAVTYKPHSITPNKSGLIL